MNQNSQFGAALRKGSEPTSQTGALLAALRSASTGRAPIVDSKAASAAIALEGMGEANRVDVETAITSLQTFTRNVASQVKLRDLTVAQESAGTVAGFVATAGKQYLASSRFAEASMKQMAGVHGNELTYVIGHSNIQGAMDKRVAPALEAYDERNNRDVVGYSVAYNLQASRQGEFGEAFFPTVTVNPDQVGFNVQLRQLYAYSEVQRAVTGATNNYNRKSMIRAIIDATILQVQQTQIIPVYRTGTGQDSSAEFVSGISPTTVTVDGQPLTTAPLAFGASFSLLGISQTAAMVAAGLEDQTDAVDSSVRLQNLYLKLDNGSGTVEYIKIPVDGLPTSDFNGAVQGNTRKLQLNFSTKDLLLTSSNTQVSGAASTLLAALTTNTVRVGVDVSGSIIQDVGDTTMMASSLKVVAANATDGTPLDLTSGAGATCAGVFAHASFVGYDLLAYRTNSNRRNRGKLLDVQHINYLYTVPLLPPITMLRPVTASDAADGNLLSDLVTATRTQTANAAVTALLDAQTTLAAFAEAQDVVVNQPQLFGAASQLVTPSYMEQTVDCATAIDSIKSADRANDLQALLINKIRDMAFLLWTQSGYGPASEAMYEGQPPKPVVIIGTDPIIARYLTLTGDTRLVGDMFEYKIVASFDSRMSGKLLFSFGQADSFNSGVPNPLHFGNMAWRPELTLMLPMVRNGAQSMELTVQPSYRHVVNLPVMGSLEVENISDVIGSKVAIDFHTV